jgi:tyrosine-protein kinase Etk/Wzc
MTPPPTLVGSLRRTRALRNPSLRRTLFGAALAIFAMLALYPERHRAAVTLLVADPADQPARSFPDTRDRPAVQAVLRIARSVEVRQRVLRRLGLIARLGVGDEPSAQRWLDDHVDARTMRGGIVQIEAAMGDAAVARQIVAAYLAATQQRLAEIAGHQRPPATLRVLEPPFVDPARQYNASPAAIGVLILLVGLGIEFYGWRPPVGERQP